MKRVITLVMLGLFGAAMIGCHASADVDTPRSTDTSGSYRKTTTTYDRDNGSKTTKTEVKTY